MRRGFFVTGTDTGIGKTFVSASLLSALNASGRRAVGMKPIASGCVMTPRGLRNDDAGILLDHSDGTPAYESINPFALREAIAPHIAAREEGIEVSLEPIANAFAKLSEAADCIVVEGVGGWCAPLSDSLMQCDLAKSLRLPVILVVGLRLGCLNHAILSARAIHGDGCDLIGWIGNGIDPAMQRVRENIDALRERLPAPCVGILPYSKDRDARRAGAHLRDAVIALSGAYPPAP
jgi:dethiobiotin synthetase